MLEQMPRRACALHNPVRLLSTPDPRAPATLGSRTCSDGRKSKTPRSALPHVALIVETSTAYGRAILSGISQYVREHGPWTVYIEQRSLQDPAPPWLERWHGDGIIARASTPQSARKLLKTGVPTVDLNDQVRGLGLPQIHSDHAAIARLAADHLIERGFRHFAYFGFPVFEWSVRRQESFTAHVVAAGHQIHEGLPARRVSLEPPASLVGR